MSEDKSYMMQILRDVYALQNVNIDQKDRKVSDGILEQKRKYLEQLKIQQQNLDLQREDLQQFQKQTFKKQDLGDGSIILKITQCGDQKENEREEIYKFLDKQIENNSLEYLQNLTQDEEELIKSLDDEEQVEEQQIVPIEREDELQVLQKSQSSVREQLLQISQVKQSNNQTPILLENNIKQFVKEESSEPSVEKQILEYSGSNVASDKIFSL